MSVIRSITLLILLLLILSACNNEPTPTPTEVPLVVATVTTAAPTTESQPEAAATDPPAATATTPPTAVATVAPTVDAAELPEVPEESTPTPSPSAPLPLEMVQPAGGAAVTVGGELTVSGTVDPAVTVVTVSLHAGPHTVVEADIAATAGAWSGSLTVPPNVTGPAQLIASAGDERAIQAINLIPGSGGGSSIRLNQPSAGLTAVAGHVVFFDGSVTGAIDETVTIGIMFEDCQTFAAIQSFTVTTGNGDWRGLVIIPQTVTGPACAVAFTGTQGEGDWREAQVPLTILDPADEGARQLWLGNPAGFSLPATGTAFLFGAAIGAPDNEVLVEIVAGDGSVLAAATASVNDFGYWETNLALAVSPGPATIRLSMGEGENQIISDFAVTIR